MSLTSKSMKANRLVGYMWQLFNLKTSCSTKNFIFISILFVSRQINGEQITMNLLQNHRGNLSVIACTMNVYQRYVVQQLGSTSPPEHDVFLIHILPLYTNHPELGDKEIHISLKNENALLP